MTAKTFKTCVRVSNAAAYGRVGFVVEFDFGDGEWALPPWKEWGHGDLATTFKTEDGAKTAVWNSLGCTIPNNEKG